MMLTDEERAIFGEGPIAERPNTVEPHRKNSYPGPCGTCRQRVEAEQGKIIKETWGWQAYHLDGQCPEPKPGPVEPLAIHPAIEAGIYINPTTGEVYKVQVAVHGSGRLYAKKLMPIEGNPKRGAIFTYKAGLIHQINSTWRIQPEQAREFGVVYGCCINCGLTLTRETSQAAGYGPTCAEHNGWPYPTEEEAALILSNRKEK